jgi:hypothetical protein
VVDTKPLLKGFGAAADVVGQIATDKAINSRRRSKGTGNRISRLRGEIDITDGQLIEGWDLATEPTGVVPHNLGRVPIGVIVVKQDIGSAADYATGFSIDTITMHGATQTVSLWVF